MENLNTETTENHVSGDEGDNQRREQPTTSRGENNSPVQNSHNMNDLQALDFNSADEVRQTMKAVLAGQLPPQSFSEEADHTLDNAQIELEQAEVTDLANKVHGHDLRKTVQRKVQQNLYLKMKSNAVQTFAANNFRSIAQKRRGRPMKAGPSKSVKRSRKSLLYIGKLSNVVQFRRQWTPESGSDAESVYY